MTAIFDYLKDERKNGPIVGTTLLVLQLNLIRAVTSSNAAALSTILQGSKLTGVLLPGACKICLGQLKSLG